MTNKYIATYKDTNGTVEIMSFNGTSLFEVDVRAKNFGDSMGWTYISLDVA